MNYSQFKIKSKGKRGFSQPPAAVYFLQNYKPSDNRDNAVLGKCKLGKMKLGKVGD